MNADGKLQFLTYTDKRSTVKLTPDGASNSTAYYADSLSYEDYTVKAIEKVQIRQSDSDVGVIYPDSTTATNTYAVQGNLLLTTCLLYTSPLPAPALCHREQAVQGDLCRV